MRDIRVAVVGGGPAGAHCAGILAAGGARVTLFEPRVAFEKACGGGVPVRALEHFPFLIDPRLPAQRIGRCVIIAPSGREARFPLRDPLLILRRADLHTFLLERAASAGATIARARVIGLARRGALRSREHRSGPPWLLTVVEAAGTHDEAGRSAPPVERGPFDFLVGADGASGLVRRRLRGVDRVDVAQGIGYYLPDLSEDAILLRFFEHLRGYLWVFPRLDHASAGICARLGDPPATRLRNLLDRFIEDRYGPGRLAGAGRYAALIPGAPAHPSAERVQGDGWALIGDAGRFVDPLTREGIYYAMLSGELMARALLAGSPERYARDWARGCGPELSWASRHADSFFAAPFIESLVALCGQSHAVAGALSDLIAGRQSYRTLKLRLVLKTPALGWELARRALAGRRTAGRWRCGRDRGPGGPRLPRVLQPPTLTPPRDS